MNQYRLSSLTPRRIRAIRRKFKGAIQVEQIHAMWREHLSALRTSKGSQAIHRARREAEARAREVTP